MIKLIEDTASLEAFCAQLQNQKFITIDLEFIREKTYYAELALIQVGSEAECAIIDPLAPGLNMHSFFMLLENPAIEKVFHAGHQDIEILYMLTHKIPYPVLTLRLSPRFAVSEKTSVTKIWSNQSAALNSTNHTGSATGCNARYRNASWNMPLPM